MAVARFDAIREIAFGSITGSYTEVGTPLTQNWREFRITNTTNGGVYISADGTTDNFFLPSNSFLLWDLATNAPSINNTDTFVLALQTQFYALSDDSLTSGSVRIEGIYARGA